MNRQARKTTLGNSAGVSILELVVVGALIAIVSSLALISFQKSSKSLSLSDAVRTFSVYLERVRVDSERRHGGASISLNSQSSYTVNLDSTGSGTVTAQTITLPVGARLSYSLPPATTSISPSDTPITIAYDWRGRTAQIVSLTLTDSSSATVSSTIVVGNAGDISVDAQFTGPVTAPTPQNTTVTTTTGIKSMQ